MKMKLGEINEIASNMQELEDCVLPPKICYSIAYNKKNIEEQATLYNQEMDKLVLRYAIKNESGEPIGEDIGNGQVRYNIEDIKGYTEELKDLDETAVEIDIRTVPARQIDIALQDEKYTPLSVKQYSVLSFMLED